MVSYGQLIVTFTEYSSEKGKGYFSGFKISVSRTRGLKQQLDRMTPRCISPLRTYQGMLPIYAAWATVVWTSVGRSQCGIFL